MWGLELTADAAPVVDAGRARARRRRQPHGGDRRAAAAAARSITEAEIDEALDRLGCGAGRRRELPHDDPAARSMRRSTRAASPPTVTLRAARPQTRTPFTR